MVCELRSDKQTKIQALVKSQSSNKQVVSDNKGDEMTNHAYIRGNMVWVDATFEGKRYRVSTNKKADKFNLAWANKHYIEIITRHIVSKKESEKKDASGKTSFKEFAEKCLEIYQGRIRLLTYRSYVSDIQKYVFGEFANIALEDIRPSMVAAWQNKLSARISNKRINNIRSVFSMILKDAVMDELIKRNPFDSVRKLTNEKAEINPLTLEEVQRVISVADPHFANVLKLAFFTGMRTGEMIALRWDKIDFEKETIRIDQAIRCGMLNPPKTQTSIRTIKMLPHVKEALLNLKQDNDSEWVLPTQNGTMLYEPKTLSKKWKETLQKAGLEHRVFYQTRHTFASLMIAANEDPLWVSSIMGHADATITFKRYAKNLATNKARAAFLNNLDI